MDITPADIGSLGAKLDALDLTDAERGILDGILERAASAEADVEGFTYGNIIFTGNFDAMGPTATKIAGLVEEAHASQVRRDG